MRSNFYIISVLNVGQIVSWTLLILSSSSGLYATIDHSRLWPRDSPPSLASSNSHSVVIGLVTYIICHTATLHRELSRPPCSIRKAFQFTFPNRVRTHVIIMILDMYIIINPVRTDGWSQIYLFLRSEDRQTDHSKVRPHPPLFIGCKARSPLASNYCIVSHRPLSSAYRAIEMWLEVVVVVGSRVENNGSEKLIIVSLTRSKIASSYPSIRPPQQSLYQSSWPNRLGLFPWPILSIPQLQLLMLGLSWRLGMAGDG